MLDRIADWLILRPSRDPIPAPGKTRRSIRTGRHEIEVWSQPTGSNGDRADLFVLKFPGAGGRAERATPHPADCWDDLAADVWAVNPPGYGGSSGRAALAHFAGVARAVAAEIATHADGRPLIVAGNSLGCTAALLVAAEFEVAGVVLRNPPPLRELITERFGRWNFQLASGMVARRVPRELCSLTNAVRCSSPAVFVMSGRDSIVPPGYQRQIHAAYGGPHRVVEFPEADHATLPTEREEAQYRDRLGWLREQFDPRGRNPR